MSDEKTLMTGDDDVDERIAEAFVSGLRAAGEVGERKPAERPPKSKDPRKAAPPPSVEQMIEEITKDGWILHGGRSDARPEGHEYVFWLTAAFRDGGTLLEDGPDADGATAMEALTNLHGAWRERE